MPAPRHAKDLDPKNYPLAGSPTPATLKNIAFSLDGRSVLFREATNVAAELEQIEEEESSLSRNHGNIRSIRNTSSTPSIKEEEMSPSAQLLQNLTERPASPESIAEGESQSHLSGASQTRSGKGRNGKQRTIHSNMEPDSRLRAIHQPSPITPELRAERSTRRRQRAVAVEDTSLQNVFPSPAIEQQQISRARTHSLPQERFEQSVGHEIERTSSRTLSRASYDSAVPTPPIEPEDISIPENRLSARALSSIPTRLHVSQSPSVQDGTLPSPSLSPVTAAINTQQNEYFADIDSNSEFGSQFGHSIGVWNGGHFEQSPSHARYESPAMTETALSDDEHSELVKPAPPSVRDIPAMLNLFEALPDGMKSYVMHQLLRRCPKSTLHVVADAVNPVLKCDFLTLLPAELGLNILRYLDLQSLCRASQVSKKWRQMINSDERAWKELFEADGYTLPEGELQQAIVQGWGWQDPWGPQGREMDLSRASSTRIDGEAGSAGFLSIPKLPVISSLRRSKRKAATQLTNRSKMAKRQAMSRETSVDLESMDWMAQMSTVEGPYNAANAAVLAVPNPELPIPSLKGLHLYKSLYRRHHLIRRNWMSEETKPHHLAFKAHGSHVVTCLQFDTSTLR